MKRRKLANGNEPSSRFGTAPLVFHNLGHLMVFESVWGNAAAVLREDNKEKTQKEHKEHHVMSICI